MRPGRGAVVKVPVMFPREVSTMYSYGRSGRRCSMFMTVVKSVSLVSQYSGWLARCVLCIHDRSVPSIER